MTEVFRLIKKLVNKLKENKVLEVASINSLGILVRLISGFVISKFMAIFIGPSGMAISGNMSNFMQSIQSLSSLGIKNGIIKYTAENQSDKTEFKKVLSSGFFLSLAIGSLLGIMLILFSEYCSVLVFGGLKSYSYLFQISGLIMPFFSVQVFFIAVLNGIQKVKALVFINVVTYILSSVLMLFFMWKQQIDGALLAIVITPFVLFLSLFVEFNKMKIIIGSISIHNVSQGFLPKLLSFFSMTLVSGIMVPVIFILIRNYVIDHVGLNQAGYWEGIRKLSNYYMLFIYALFDMYLLPLLSKSNSEKGFKTIVFNFYKSVLPFVFIGFVFIYLFRTILISLIFTKAFLPMDALFIWQLLGDFFRILFLTISYQFLAKRMIKLYILSEIIYMLILYFSSVYFVNYLGVIGVVKAHAFSSFIYFAFLIFIFRKALIKKV